MKSIFLVFFTIAMIPASTMAQVVVPQLARKYALTAYLQHCQPSGPSMGIVEQLTLNGKDGKPTCYLFAFKQGGFIILAADYAASPVIGYHQNNRLDFKDLPPALTDWLDHCSRQIDFIRERGLKADEKISLSWNKIQTGEKSQEKSNQDVVAPLLPVKWGQRNPYNQLCPVDSASADSHVATGCAATAFAQVMSYYNYPDHGIGSNSYIHPVYGQISANFAEATYRWNLMLDIIPLSLPQVVKEAPALIGYHVGVAMNMSYGPNGSGVIANQVLQPMIDHFGYNPTSNYAWRSDYTQDAWVALLHEQLDSGYPLIYRGTTTTLGHVFVCDGYQDDEYFHFNWGWFGNANGYFSINNLNPLTYTFNLNNYCIPDFYPAGTYPNYCSSCDTLIESVSLIEDGSGPVKEYLDNSLCTWLIAPGVTPAAGQIRIHFRNFDTEENHDYLRIYSGEPSGTFPVGEYSGQNIPDDIVVMNDSAWICFTSDDNGINGKGWEIQYACNDYPAIINPQGENNTSCFRIFPNPAKEFVTIATPDNHGDLKSIKLVNPPGWEGGSSAKVIRINNRTWKMDISNISKGFYLIFADFADGKTYISKLVIQ